MSDIKIVDREVLDTLKICHLHADLGMTYQDISKYVGTSIATVGRKIKVAKEDGWLIDRVSFVVPEEFQDIQNYFKSMPDLEKCILDRFNDRLDKITIVPSGANQADALKYATAAAAKLLEEKLTGNNYLGVNWGSTTLSIAETLRPDKPNSKLICVPIFGNLGLPDDAQYKETSLYESSRVAYLVAQKFKTTIEPIPLSFHAFIPIGVNEGSPEWNAIMDYVKCDVSYEKVFGEKSGLIYEIDTMISGIGLLDAGVAWFRSINCASRSNRDPKPELEKLRNLGVVGDIGQHFVTEKGLISEPNPPIDEINKRIIGLDARKHFVGLVKKYHESKEPKMGAGLIIVAVGSHKAQITITAIRTGINHLIIDENLAMEIIKIIDK
jgi:DNA-binding transcriptional regulator LsrR (DeoR family)